MLTTTRTLVRIPTPTRQAGHVLNTPVTPVLRGRRVTAACWLPNEPKHKLWVQANTKSNRRHFMPLSGLCTGTLCHIHIQTQIINSFSMGLEKGLRSQEQALVLLLQKVDSVPCTVLDRSQLQVTPAPETPTPSSGTGTMPICMKSRI